jgi:error-prone DNA polymerase
LEPVLKDTLGAIVFQDQVIEVSMAMAGFSPGEAEGLRRAMSRKRSGAAMERQRERFIEGAVGNGVDRGIAERVFQQIQGFSGFGFPKSHSTAFGLLAYQSTWLRVHYAPEFLCALLNEQPMGFYPPDALAHEAQRRGIEIRRPDVNASQAECHTEGGAVRVGLGYVAEVRSEDVEVLVAERERGGSYADLADLAARSGAGPSSLEKLAWAGACDELATGPLRRAPLWTVGAAATGRRQRDGTQLAMALDGAEPPLKRNGDPALPELQPWERLTADYRSTGMTLDEHPMSLLRGDLADTVTSRDLERIADGARVELAGMVVARQRPSTAKGVVFMLLEDEWGVLNLVLPPPVARQDRLVLRTAGFVRAAGKLERREGVINLVVTRLRALSRPDLPVAQVRELEQPTRAIHGEPSPGASGGEAERPPADVLAQRRADAAAELTAALPPAHSFGRRGR